MFDRSKLESLCDVSVTRIGDTLSYGFPQTEQALRLSLLLGSMSGNIFQWTCKSQEKALDNEQFALVGRPGAIIRFDFYTLYKLWAWTVRHVIIKYDDVYNMRAEASYFRMVYLTFTTHPYSLCT